MPNEDAAASSPPIPIAGPSRAGPLALSIAIVCKNNEETIGRTLESVAPFASELVAVDSGSTDGTIALLERYRARVIRSDWLGHIRTKQKALDACTKDWILCIDSDESIEPDLAASIRNELSAKKPSADGFFVNRKVYYRDKPLNHAWQPEWRLRLVRNGHFRWGGLDPHDALQEVSPAEGCQTARLAGVMRHDSIGTFGEFFVKQASHAKTMARSVYAEGGRGSILKLLTSPTGAFLKQIVIKQAWRDGYPGWLAATATATGTLMKHAVLIELSRPNKP